MTLQDLLLGQFKVKTRQNINPEVSVLTGGVDRILGNNPNRLAWVIVNLGLNVAYLGFDQDVSATRGIVLTGGGGFVSMLWSEEFETVGYEIYCQGTLADNLYVIEIVTA